MFKTPVIRMIVYVLLALIVAMVTYSALSATGVLTGQNYKFGGGIAGFLAVFAIMMTFDARNHLSASRLAGLSKKNLLSQEPVALQINSDEDYRVYNNSIREGILQAKHSLVLYFQMLRRSSDGPIPQIVNEALRERASQGTIEITVITAAEYDRLAGACELKNIPNVKVLFSEDLRSSDLSFTLIDGSCILFGVKKDDVKSISYDPSNEWIMLKSMHLGHILSDYVISIQQTSVPYGDFARAKVKEYTQGSYDAIPVAVKKLRLPRVEVERILIEG